MSASPGPWRWDDQSDKLCDGNGASFGIRRETPLDEIDRANDTLIALAPEMAEMLREIGTFTLRCFKRLGGDPTDKRCAEDAPQRCTSCRLAALLARLP